jgi:peptide/nickel transport system substrate-binding protein
VLAESIPPSRTAARQGRAIGDLAAQEERRLARRRALHRRRRDLQLDFSIDPANATSSRPSFEEVSRIDKLDSHTVKVVYKKPQPFWAAVFTSGGLLPRHIFEPSRGPARATPSAWSSRSGPGRTSSSSSSPATGSGRDQPTYHVVNRPYFDRLDIKCGGDSPGTVRAVMQTGEYDFAYYVLMEEDLLRRLEQGATKGRILTIPSPAVSFIQLNHSDPWTEVDGERSSPRSTHPFLSDPAVRTALGLLVDRASIQEHLVGRTGQITANFLNAPERFRSRSLTWEFNVDKANQVLDQAGWVRGTDGIRAKDGKRLKMLYQAAANATVQKVQMVVKQAAARAGIEIEVKAVQASVFFASDVNNPDTNVRFLADLQTYTTFTGLDPQGFMAQFVSWDLPSRENKWTGRNIARWRNADFDRLWRQAEVEMDPVKRAALFIRMNDLVVQQGVVIPITWRSVLHAAGTSLAGIESNGWDSIFGRIAYWYRT